MDQQRRYLNRPADPIQLRENAAGALPTITGYAAVFYNAADTAGTEFRLWRDCYERIMPTAFDRALAEKHDVRGLFNHDANHVLGRTTAGTLRLIVDQRGLRYEIDPPNTEGGRALIESVRRRDVTGSSFAFIPRSFTDKRDGDKDVIEVNDVDLLDVGPVVFPAYSGTEAGVRVAGNLDTLRREWERRRATPDLDRLAIELLLLTDDDD